MANKSVLGRGVGALLSADFDNDPNEQYLLLDIDKINPNPNQPRKYFDEEKLQALAASIREKGVIQPLLVTKGKNNRYNLIAGERRLRAARIAGRYELPVVVMEDNGENESLELALIENIQRHDLNPMEEAAAYHRLIEHFNMTQEEVATKVGRNRTTITNVVRLLQLSTEIQANIIEGSISEGHARVLLRLKDDPEKQLELRDKIIQDGLSVRQTETLCKQMLDTEKPKKIRTLAPLLPDTYCKEISTSLSNRFKSKIRIVQKGAKGKVEIEYLSSEDLDRLVSLLTQ
ncbi:MAG: ParB/RepB/Spo0J family partition protein [Desulfobulbaceae bacterium]|nr:ParB/RepB/Spo0J family partition protein [Desulfobulbaceae bacterium]